MILPSILALPLVGALLSFFPATPSGTQLFRVLEIPPLARHMPTLALHYPPAIGITFGTTPQPVTIDDLLEKGQIYHEQLVSIQGLITQPELHLDKTELYLNFVFRLSQGINSLIVFGQHDRTTGPPAISVNQAVEVIGIFFQKQNRNGSIVSNVIQAISVRPYPSPIPEST